MAERQSFDLQINGKSELITEARLLRTFDTPADGFTAKIFYDFNTDEPLVKPFHPVPVQIFLENELMLTGAITNPNPEKTATSTSYDLEGFSNTYNFMDSHLQPPYEFNNQDLKQIINAAALQTNTHVIYTPEAKPPRGVAVPAQRGTSKSVFDRATITPGQTGYTFCKPLAKDRNMVLSSTVNGDLLVHQPDFSQEPVGTLEEGVDFELTNYKGSYNYRDRFKTFKAILPTKTGSISSYATDKNITQPRHKIIKIDDQSKGGLYATISYHKNLAIIAALSEPLNVIGWRAPNGKLWEPGTFITVKSKTLGYPDGFTLFIRSVEYVQPSVGKVATLHTIPPNVYTNEDIIEPYFQSS